MRPRSVVVLTVLAAGLSGGGVALADGGLRPGRAPVDPQPVLSASTFWNIGPSAQYGGDSGSIGGVRPLSFTIPSDGDYDAVVEVDLSYRIPFGGRATLAAGVRPAGSPDVDNAAALPTEVQLPVSRKDAPTSARFLVEDLPAGETWEVSPSVNSVDGFGDRFRVKTHDVVLTVELTPAQ